jgi:type IV pilus assembly protein PilY1
VDGQSVVRLARTALELGAQPITVQPELAEIDGRIVVFFGTGRLLGESDVSTHVSASRQQSVYAVKDSGTFLGTLAEANLVELTLNSLTDPRTSSSATAINWATHNGWRLQVPLRERFNVDPSLQLGVLNIAANIPRVNDDRCNPRGASIFYQLDYKTGKVLNTERYESQVVGNTTVQLPNGTKVNILVMADGTTVPQPDPPTVPPAGGVTRISWREIE